MLKVYFLHKICKKIQVYSFKLSMEVYGFNICSSWVGKRMVPTIFQKDATYITDNKSRK